MAGSAISSSPDTMARCSASTAAPLVALIRRVISAVPMRTVAVSSVVASARASRARRAFPRAREWRHTQS
ncbi:hypothetical protein CG724_08815 [Streptomyces sp. CB02120-2]|nr:hypothetical protein CG724_08815 [Streptomyces sp. CB02120-2]